MQINNTKTNEIYRISRIDITGNRIIYNSINLDESIKSSSVYVPEPVLSSYLDQTINFYDLCYTILLSNIFINDCELSEDILNWRHSTRFMRLLVPKFIILESLQNQDNLSLVINRMINENYLAAEKFVYQNNDFVIVYINEISESDSDIVLPYILNGQIINQTK